MYRVALLSMIFALPACNETTGGNGGKGTTVVSDSEEFEGDDPGECSDGADNDKDGWFDCGDQDCQNSPECQDDGTGGTGTGGTGTGGTGTGGTGTGGTGTGGTGTGGPTPGPDCDTPICDLKNVSLTYTLVVDANEELDSFPGITMPSDCLIEMEGGGDFWSVDSSTVTFIGFWEEISNNCEGDLVDLVPQWLGGAFHSFYFDPAQTVLLDWYAHRDEQEVGTDADPVFYMTEIEYLVDMSAVDPSIDYLFEEMIPLDPVFLPDTPFMWLAHELKIDFDN